MPAAAAVGSTLSGRVDPGGVLSWLTDLAVHWQWVYLAAASLAGLALAFVDVRRVWVAVVGVAACVVCTWHAAPGLPASSGPGPRLKVMSANVYLGNDDLGRVVSLIEHEAPDVVFLQEVAATVMSQLPLARYPHMLVRRPIESYGVVVLSKHPFRESGTVELMRELEGHRFSHRATLDWNGRAISVAAVHLAAPMNAGFHAARDRLLRETVGWTQEQKRPALIAGDLNATPWSRPLRAAAASGLRRATSLEPTWRVTLPWVPATIPIDQVLGSAHWTVVERRVGPDIGSDHRPVIVTLALSNEPR